MKIAVIAAIGMNGELGKEGKLPWHIPEDLQHFKRITQGNTVVMGRKTFESLPVELAERTVIVVTTQTDYVVKSPNVLVMHTLGEVIKYAHEKNLDNLYVAGGGQMYIHFMPMADLLYLTIVEETFAADTYFKPAIDIGREWKLTSLRPSSDGKYNYAFEVYERMNR